jgi:glucosamine-phosphate N-acetyltransferase
VKHQDRVVATVRPLRFDDYARGFPAVLSDLTVVGDVTETQFKERFAEMQATPSTYYIICVEIPAETAGGTAKTIVGSGSVIIEKKFIRNVGRVGHIEDIVVSASMRGNGLGEVIIWLLCAISEQAGCYKAILDCSPDNAPFYQKCGLVEKEVKMEIRFPQPQAKTQTTV